MTVVAPKMAWSHMMSASDIPISSFQKRVMTGIGKRAARSPLPTTSKAGLRSEPGAGAAAVQIVNIDLRWIFANGGRFYAKSRQPTS